MKSSVIYIISILLFVFFLLSSGKLFSCRRLSCVTMNGLNDFKIKDIYQESNSTFRAFYANKEKMLRVETIFQLDRFTASQYINADISQIKGLYTDALAPYPGIASNRITCDIRYQPLFDKMLTADKLEISYFIGYLNNNLTYGSCTEAQVIYKGISAYFYCSKKKLVYHLEIIAPRKAFESSIKDYQNMIGSIKCR